MRVKPKDIILEHQRKVRHPLPQKSWEFIVLLSTDGLEKQE